MKTTENQIRHTDKKEAKALNEGVGVALAVKAILSMLDTEGGRRIIAKVLRWPQKLAQATQGLDDYVADALGTESPDFLNKMQKFVNTVATGPFDYAADFIEGLDDEEASALAGALGSTDMKAGSSTTPAELPMNEAE